MTTPFLKFDSDNFDIIYREYQESDSEGAIALEQEASQIPTLGGLIEGGTIFSGAYDAKCKKFPDHLILLAEAIDKERPQMRRICGCACIGIKDIYFNQRKIRAGVLFDLRVSEKFQKRGIGTKLTALLEEKAREKGCQFFYLSVNGNNKKARALYEKTGYNIISQRKIDRYSVEKVPIEDRKNTKTINIHGKSQELVFNKLSHEETRQYYSKFYQNEDLALLNFDEIINSPGYVGTYGVSAGENNMVGLTLYRTDLANIMGVKRLIFPVHYYAKDWFYSFGLSCFLLISYAITLSAYEKFSYLESFWRKIVTGLVFLPVTWLLTWINRKINNTFLSIGNMKTKGRYLGMFYSLRGGEKEYLKPMMDFLLERMNKVCSDNHLENVIINSDKNDKFMRLLKGNNNIRFYTYFMGKFIEKNNTNNNQLVNYKPSEFIFFDPRDL